MVYDSGSQVTIMSLSNTDINDISDASNIKSLMTGITGTEVVSTMFSTVADISQFLVITTDASDVPMMYDGTAITQLAFTGLSDPPENINYVCSYYGRLFYATKGRLGFYYMAPGAIQGAANWFDIGQISNEGGYLAAITTYSTDAGDGPGEYIVFITSRGEYIMYEGIDPGDANNWQVVGRYKSSMPVGRNCIVKYAGDTLILTTEGVLQFSSIRQLADVRFAISALTSKLGSLITDSVAYVATPGWGIIHYPRGGLLLANVPASSLTSGAYNHFAMNTTTNAWALMKSQDWDGLCWVVANHNLYFGRYDGSVRQAFVGFYDQGNPIAYSVRQAYNYFNGFGYKHFKWAQFQVRSDAPVTISSRLSVDFKDIPPLINSTGLVNVTGATWDVSFWDQDFWAVMPYAQNIIQSYGAYGIAASHWIGGDSAGTTLEWFSTDYVYEQTTGLLG
jgi:hypothetical protein